MAPKAKSDPKAEGLSSSSKNSTDVMLQGTYEQDESNDLAHATSEIAAFEARLEQQHKLPQRAQGRTPAALPMSKPGVSGGSKRPSGPLNGGARSPHPPSNGAPSATANATSSPRATAHRANDRRLSEEERAAQIQRGVDVEDVRNLEDQFGNDGDSDDETTARRRKMGL
ncbi:hypothetical protein JKF63_03574 [Porcisia hertigi]|uniref:Uncharacterized protein n=1 Tax=Porcisia hertigi TaxID=2761500 RepID=A0A836L6A8_9TRYP|nr:hypothetical protein JKF63_03574 [Porcisia hertigi]